METNSRLLILQTLVDIDKHECFAKEAIHKTFQKYKHLSKQEKAFITRMIEGVTEYRIRLDFIINQYSKIHVLKCKPVIRTILRMGVYQMYYMDSVPNETACDECVKLAKKKGYHSLSGFVNGILRNVNRNLDKIEYPNEEMDYTLFASIQYSMPLWLVEKLLDWHGKDMTNQILKASVGEHLLSIRVNANQTTKEIFQKQLKDNGITVNDGIYAKEALRVSDVQDIREMPGFMEGAFFVQDESSMLAGKLANPKEGDFVLDLCAAPGGKATHIATLLNGTGTVLARDLTKQKTERIEENATRLGLTNIKVQVFDALKEDQMLFGKADIVVADLPCSGLGVMGKKNDIKYHVNEIGLSGLIILQREILKNAARYVKPNGILIYSTCTINPDENENNVEWFLNHFPFALEDIKEDLPEMLHPYIEQKGMLRLVQGELDCDGFFIAKVRQRESNIGH